MSVIEQICWYFLRPLVFSSATSLGLIIFPLFPRKKAANKLKHAQKVTKMQGVLFSTYLIDLSLCLLQTAVAGEVGRGLTPSFWGGGAGWAWSRPISQDRRWKGQITVPKQWQADRWASWRAKQWLRSDVVMTQDYQNGALLKHSELMLSGSTFLSLLSNNNMGFIKPFYLANGDDILKTDQNAV